MIKWCLICGKFDKEMATHLREVHRLPVGDRKRPGPGQGIRIFCQLCNAQLERCYLERHFKGRHGVSIFDMPALEPVSAPEVLKPQNELASQIVDGIFARIVTLSEDLKKARGQIEELTKRNTCLEAKMKLVDDERKILEKQKTELIMANAQRAGVVHSESWRKET